MKRFLLILILFLAAFVRLYRLTDFPAGFNADEAALGYNAYSLLLTGMDEHGHPYPVNLESFGDFKPALYAYLLIPFIKYFGLTELAVRLPAALAGVALVYVVYLLGWEIFRRHQPALLSALALSFMPWAIHFSRGGWEVNVATLFIALGLYLWLKYRSSTRVWYLLSGSFFFIASMYTYQSARIIAPLVALGFLIFEFSFLRHHLRHVLIALAFGVVLLSPLAYSLFSSDAASRFSGVGLLADEGPLNRVKELRGQHSDWNSLTTRILHNRQVAYSLLFVSNFLSHFSPDFLFVTGDEVVRSKIPDFGQLYLLDFVFLAAALVYLLRHSTSTQKYIWWWLFVGPVASALTFQVPSSLRSQNLVVPFTLLIGVGIYYLAQTLLSRKILFPIFIAMLTGSIYQTVLFFHQYFVHYPQTYPAAWEYGFKEMTAYVSSVSSRYDQILITDKYDQPYILYLFFAQVPPQDFQFAHSLTFRDKFNFSTVNEFSKFHFRSTPWEQVRDIHSTLIVAAPEDIPEVGVNIVKTIYFPNSQPAFKIISN